ncbi:MAG: domain 2 [Planctomycetaceae bacterium]|nr:domain 2 [Planctomycetaceae bacterium]
MPDNALNSQWYYTSNGKNYGPVSWSVIESMVQEDRLSPQDLVSRVGTSAYLRIEEVHQLLSPPEVVAAPEIVSGAVSSEQVATPEIPPVPAVALEPLPTHAPAPWPDLGDSPVIESDDGGYRLEPIPESPPLPPDAFMPKSKPAKSSKAAKTRKVEVPEEDEVPASSEPIPPEIHRTAAELRLKPQQLIFALEVGVLWAISCALLLVLGNQLGSAIRSLSHLFVFCLSLVYYNVVAATVGHMLSREKEKGRPVSSSAGWKFALPRAALMIIGPLVLAIGAGSMIAMSGALIHAISHSAWLGSLMGPILFIPAFLMVIVVVCLAMGTSIIPVVMGIGDCSPSDALRICRERSQNSDAQLLLDCLTVFARITPMLLLSSGVTLCGLAGAMWLTENMSQLAEFELGFSTFFRLTAWLVAVAMWLSFAFVLLTTGMAAKHFAESDE